MLRKRVWMWWGHFSPWDQARSEFMTACEASQYLQENKGRRKKEKDKRERENGWVDWLKVNHEAISDNEEKQMILLGVQTQGPKGDSEFRWHFLLFSASSVLGDKLMKQAAVWDWRMLYPRAHGEDDYILGSITVLSFLFLTLLIERVERCTDRCFGIWEIKFPLLPLASPRARISDSKACS